MDRLGGLVRVRGDERIYLCPCEYGFQKNIVIYFPKKHHTDFDTDSYVPVLGRSSVLIITDHT